MFPQNLPRTPIRGQEPRQTRPRSLTIVIPAKAGIQGAHPKLHPRPQRTPRSFLRSLPRTPIWGQEPRQACPARPAKPLPPPTPIVIPAEAGIQAPRNQPPLHTPLTRTPRANANSPVTLSPCTRTPTTPPGPSPSALSRTARPVSLPKPASTVWEKGGCEKIFVLKLKRATPPTKRMKNNLRRSYGTTRTNTKRMASAPAGNPFPRERGKAGMGAGHR